MPSEEFVRSVGPVCLVSCEAAGSEVRSVRTIDDLWAARYGVFIAAEEGATLRLPMSGAVKLPDRMTANQIWILVLVALLAILKFAPDLVRRVTLLLLGEKGRAAVGLKAIAAQPDYITLLPRQEPPGTKAAGILQAMAELGFAPAGSFSVTEMGAMPIDFMVKPAESAVLAVYEHPQAGVWLDLFTRYQDGTSFTFATNTMGSGLEQRPGHPCVRVAALAPAAAYARFVREPPAQAARPFAAAEVPAMFADSYAESIAWRKKQGISGKEVERVGMEEFKKEPR